MPHEPGDPHQVVPSGAGHHRHTVAPLRRRRAAAGAGLLAGVLALGIGVFALAGGASDTEFSRDAGPSARHITARATLPLDDAQILQLLTQPVDLGALTEPRRCLNHLGLPADTPILGAGPVLLGERHATVLVLPGGEPSAVQAVVVAPDCPTAGTGVLARTELARP
ncbi:MAG: hypothetical protein ACSLFA_14100 [Mycobacterium sp.]